MERKGQIFFFGRPGCLKQSIPIRVSEEEEAEKKNDDSVALGGNNESQKPTHTSDDDTDGDELMKRISEVLEDEPGNNFIAFSMSRAPFYVINFYVLFFFRHFSES